MISAMFLKKLYEKKHGTSVSRASLFRHMALVYESVRLQRNVGWPTFEHLPYMRFTIIYWGKKKKLFFIFFFNRSEHCEVKNKTNKYGKLIGKRRQHCEESSTWALLYYHRNSWYHVVSLKCIEKAVLRKLIVG